MSALDQAFIRAYTKDTALERVRVVTPTAVVVPTPVAASTTQSMVHFGTITIPTANSNTTSPATAARSVEKTEPLRSPQRAIPHPASGTHSTFHPPLPTDDWYRPEPAPSSAQSVVPAPHIKLANNTAVAPAIVQAASWQNGHEPNIKTLAPAIDDDVTETRLDPKAEQTIPAPHFRPAKAPVAIDDEGDSAGNLSSGREALLQASKTAKPKFSAVWEVDQFLWPENCLNGLSAAFDYFREAGSELRRATRGGLQILAISSAVRGEGRTTVAMCLAKAVAATGARVALVDADLENPQLGTSLGTDSTCGWDDVVRGELPLTEAGIFSLADRITLLPLSEEISRRNFSLSDARVTNTLKKIANHFELVIVDMGPVGAADRRLFAGGATCPIDAAFVVRDLRLTSHEEAFSAAARLKSNGIRSVGIVENFV